MLAHPPKKPADCESGQSASLLAALHSCTVHSQLSRSMILTNIVLVHAARIVVETDYVGYYGFDVVELKSSVSQQFLVQACLRPLSAVQPVTGRCIRPV